jgi:hypothetical protein
MNMIPLLSAPLRGRSRSDLHSGSILYLSGVEPTNNAAGNPLGAAARGVFCGGRGASGRRARQGAVSCRG